MDHQKNLNNQSFKSFADLARAMHAADVKRARGLAQTAAARKAQKARKVAK